MGAYFVRRNSNSPVYRRVLERYVHMATEAGVAQAMYPEGGLSRDGRLREPKLGLFDYMLKSFDPAGNHPPLRAQPIPDFRAHAQSHPDVRRQLVLDEVEDVSNGKPMEVIVNNSHWNGRREGSTTVIPDSVSNGHGLAATELPQVGATELWEVANMTPDAHPLHLHLIQFQVVDVQPFLTEHGLCDQFATSTQNFAGAQEYRGRFPELPPAWLERELGPLPPTDTASAPGAPRSG